MRSDVDPARLAFRYMTPVIPSKHNYETPTPSYALYAYPPGTVKQKYSGFGDIKSMFDSNNLKLIDNHRNEFKLWSGNLYGQNKRSNPEQETDSFCSLVGCVQQFNILRKKNDKHVSLCLKYGCLSDKVPPSRQVKYNRFSFKPAFVPSYKDKAERNSKNGWPYNHQERHHFDYDRTEQTALIDSKALNIPFQMVNKQPQRLKSTVDTLYAIACNLRCGCRNC